LVDDGLVFPVLQKEIERAIHIRRTLAKDGQVITSRGDLTVVARMIDRRNDKAGIRRRPCLVVMSAEPPGETVGENGASPKCLVQHGRPKKRQMKLIKARPQNCVETFAQSQP